MDRWVKGAVIGRGTFATVNLAIGIRGCNPQGPLLAAVKSAPLCHSSSLQREEEFMSQLQDCPKILRCLGSEIAAEDGGGGGGRDRNSYNLFLEYAAGGSLARFAGRLSEPEVRSCTASVLEGLSFIHGKGFVHGDVKLRNILLCEDGPKIGDFGLAKRAGERVGFRGTPLYMSPESVSRGECEAPSDIWSLGCAVAEMVTGRPPWRCPEDSDVNSLLLQIAFGEELPEIPPELSEEGRDFLSRCFERDPERRWTADMLLRHPFAAAKGAEAEGSSPASEAGTCSKISPRSVLELEAWGSIQSSLSPDSFAAATKVNEIEAPDIPSSSSSPAIRIRQLVTENFPNWSDAGDVWIPVRRAKSSAGDEKDGFSCSVSPRSEFLLALDEMPRADGAREGGSDFGLMEFDASTSRRADVIDESEVSCGGFSVHRSRGIRRRNELWGEKSSQGNGRPVGFENGWKIVGSGSGPGPVPVPVPGSSFLISSVSCHNCDCNFSFYVSDQYNQNKFY